MVYGPYEAERDRDGEKQRERKEVNLNFTLFFTQFLKNNSWAYSCSWLLNDLHSTLSE